ncbi:MAG: sialic acid synthase SpsE, partial [Glaciecola sp.]
EHVKIVRPAHGLAPKHLTTVVGSVATISMPKGTPLSWAKINSVQ